MQDKKKKTPAPYKTYALSGGRPLNHEAGTTKPTVDDTEEMRRWSKENQQ